MGKWLYVTLSCFALLGAAFFFFLGSAINLVGPHKKNSHGNVAIVEILGGIYDSRSTLEELADLKKDDAVKAVVLRIDSPGGTVSASQDIFEAVLDFKKSKPVVASMGAVAASGGYYVAAPASKILANAGSITGSIGVRMELLNVEELMQWAKVKETTLKSGRLKDIGSPTRAMTPEEKEYLEGILKNLHSQFKKAVAESRGLTVQEVEVLADGRVFTGEEAKANKLIDDIGPLQSAVRVAADLAGIKGEPDVFYAETKEGNWMDYLIDGAAERWTKSVGSKSFSRVQFYY